MTSVNECIQSIESENIQFWGNLNFILITNNVKQVHFYSLKFTMKYLDFKIFFYKFHFSFSFHWNSDHIQTPTWAQIDWLALSGINTLELFWEFEKITFRISWLCENSTLLCSKKRWWCGTMETWEWEKVYCFVLAK